MRTIEQVDLHIVRQRLETAEERLSPHAARSCEAIRKRPEEPSPVRTAYQRDRDRILHTKSFRRLKHKTQVFIEPIQDHFVTRLTHTLEVAQVARTIARALNLNEDLAEAAALGHDIGHGPFGHAGEEALAECLPQGFRHNYQSVRVLDRLEGDGAGLNLTAAVLDAIEKSSKAREDILAEGWGVPQTLEGQVVKVADAVAYLNHDILDATRAGILREEELPDQVRSTLGHTHAERLNAMVCDIIEASWAATGEGDGEPSIRFSPLMHGVANELREFMFQRVYDYDATRQEAERGKRIVIYLFRHFRDHPEAVPGGFAIEGEAGERRAADYVAGMTDRFAIRLARELGCLEAVDWRL